MSRWVDVDGGVMSLIRYSIEVVNPSMSKRPIRGFRGTFFVKVRLYL